MNRNLKLKNINDFNKQQGTASKENSKEMKLKEAANNDNEILRSRNNPQD
jgi:hypothetical protein